MTGTVPDLPEQPPGLSERDALMWRFAHSDEIYEAALNELADTITDPVGSGEETHESLADKLTALVKAWKDTQTHQSVGGRNRVGCGPDWRDCDCPNPYRTTLVGVLLNNVPQIVAALKDKEAVRASEGMALRRHKVTAGDQPKASNRVGAEKCANPECGHAVTTHNELGRCQSSTISRRERKRRGLAPHHMTDGCHCEGFEYPKVLRSDT